MKSTGHSIPKAKRMLNSKHKPYDDLWIVPHSQTLIYNVTTQLYITKI